MAIKGLRYVLLLSLTAIIAWLLGVAVLDQNPHAPSAFSNASLCIHQPGP